MHKFISGVLCHDQARLGKCDLDQSGVLPNYKLAVALYGHDFAKQSLFVQASDREDEAILKSGICQVLRRLGKSNSVLELN